MFVYLYKYFINVNKIHGGVKGGIREKIQVIDVRVIA